VGRAAYDSPWFLSQWDDIVQCAASARSLASSSSSSPLPLPPLPPEPPRRIVLDRDSVEDAAVAYMQQQVAAFPPPFHWKNIARHILGLRNGQVCCRSCLLFLNRCHTFCRVGRAIGAGCGATPHCDTSALLKYRKQPGESWPLVTTTSRDLDVG
jgi:hypothetical protein